MLRNSRDEIRLKNAKFEILATQDSLTACLNRRAFYKGIDTKWDEAKAIGTPLSCLMIDIDHFKSVNDTYGHHVGDEVLRHISRVIRDDFQEIGLVCRYGGEEFCVAVPQIDVTQAIALAEQTRVAI